MRAWLFQDSKQKQKLGEKGCPWSVGWYERDGSKRSKKIGSKSMADKFRRKKEGELANNLIEPNKRMRWTEFRKEFEAHKAATKRASTCIQYRLALDQFQEICKPVYMDSITTRVVDLFIAKRSAQEGIEASTVNKDLRHLRHAFNKAVDWGVMPKAPKIEFQQELERDPEYINDEGFAALYEACDQMTKPAGKHFEPSGWWRALITFAYLTGWRIREVLQVSRDNLDFGTGIVSIPAEHTKGRRDAQIELPEAVLDHLKPIVGFDQLLFTWPHNERLLWVEFAKLKKAAGLEFSGAFHRLRFGFCNANVDNMPEDLLQHFMRHRDRATTRHYINTVDRMRRAGKAALVHVPEVLQKKA